MNARRFGLVVVVLFVLAAWCLAPGVAGAAGGDTTPPQLHALTVTPAVVDTTPGPQSVTVTATITDDLSGVSSPVYVNFMSPVHGQFQHAYLVPAGGATYAGTITIPRYAENGVWTPVYFEFGDAAGNEVVLYAPSLAAMGATITVSGPSDTAPPSLDTLTVNPSSIDVSSASQNVTVTAVVEDALSGVSDVVVVFWSPSHGQHRYLALAHVSGDTYAGTVTFPRYAESGTWTVYYFEAHDAAGNTLDLGGAGLVTIAVTGISDTTPPAVGGMAVTPTAIDTTLAARTVTVTAVFTDALSGFASAGVGFWSPSHNQDRYGDFAHVVGSTYSATITFPRYAEGGVWTAEYVEAGDAAGNWLELSGLQLSQLGINPTITVTVGPRITWFAPTSGPAGTSVTINGAGFTGATAVRFHGIPASFGFVSDAKLTATVPAGASTGPISVTTPLGTATSASNFTVSAAPIVTSFTPTSGVPGTSVTINGSGFTGATAVRFHGSSATFHVVSDAKITATVPSGATTGTISVTTPRGTGTSLSSFTVTVGQHPRSVTLGLHRHLVARGVVHVSDGFSACAASVTIRVQFREHHGWHGVGVGETNAFGRFHVHLVEREGIYRVVAVREVTGTGDVCRPAFSDRVSYYPGE